MLLGSKKVLKEYFGYDSFKDGQLEIIQNILSKRDTLGIMPTGAGKSICYQVPALLFDHLTIVISPLISLMKDQVDALVQAGVPCGFINSSLEPIEVDYIMMRAELGEYKLLYIAPERLQNDRFLSLLNNINVSMIAVDEAHCVSQWGHDFRPSYKYISEVIDGFANRPVVSAFTATATEHVKKDIISLLKLNDPYVAITGFDRPNLYFEVQTIPKADKFITAANFVNNHIKQSGIIYCNTRNDVESVTERLVAAGISAAPYHAGLSSVERSKNQEDFIYDRTDVIVATNAFGMGIDKPNVRYVLHYGMPKSIEAYYQEAGRAGRDGEPAECILLFCADDVRVNKFLIMNSEVEDDGHHQKEHLQKLQQMTGYCYTDTCLRKHLLIYFGDRAMSECGNCSNCKNDSKLVDITIECQKILSCIKRMNENFGAMMVCQVLIGSKSKKVKQFGFNKLSTYGIMNEYNSGQIKDMIMYLVSRDYLSQTNEQYPLLKLNLNSYKILKGNIKVHQKEAVRSKKASTGSSSISNVSTVISNTANVYNKSLFAELEDKRNQIAAEKNLPPYIILNDVSLKEMAGRFPKTDDEFLQIRGIGQSKLEQYGETFMEIIRKYTIEAIPKNLLNLNKTKKSQESQKPKASQKPKQPRKLQKTNTRFISYNFYCEGKSIEEIAIEREVTVMTIENHLVDCMLMGLKVDGLVQHEFSDEIVKVIDDVGTAMLKPIKERLPDEVTYATIKYYVGMYQKNDSDDESPSERETATLL